MNFQLISDLHTDTYYNNLNLFIDSLEVVSDILVIAGDVSECSSLRSSLIPFINKWKYVVYVTGNHEYYQTSDKKQVDIVLYDLMYQYANFHWLNKSSVMLNGIMFHGATLWFFNRIDQDLYKRYIGDFHYIPNFEPWVYDEHQLTIDFFKSSVQKGDVIVTHHMPSEICVSPKYKGSSLNRFFVGHIDNILKTNEPAVAAFGHTHDFIDIQIYNTRAVCNPRGYPGEHKNFKYNFLVEL